MAMGSKQVYGYDPVFSEPVMDTEENLRAQGIEPIPDIAEEFEETLAQFVCNK